jgi:hypothetical protein
MRKFSLFLSCFCFAVGCHAQQAYKWVDAQGRTHYSQNKDEAAGALAQEVDITPPPRGTPSPRPARPQPARSQVAASAPKAKAPAASAAPKQPYAGAKPETDEQRCALARKVLKGTVRHGNGAPIDEHDQNVAQNDVRTFCRS